MELGAKLTPLKHVEYYNAMVSRGSWGALNGAPITPRGTRVWVSFFQFL